MKFKNRILPEIALASLAAAVSFVGCGQGQGTDESRRYASQDPRMAQTEAGFDSVRDLVVASKCLRCHKEFATETSLLAATDDDGKPIVVPGDPAASPFFTEVRDGTMPKRAPRLSGNEVELIRTYILRLAPTTPVNPPTTPSPSPSPSVEPSPVPSPSPVASPVPTVVTFAMLKSAIIDTKCLRCHKDLADETGLYAATNDMDEPFLVPGQPESSPLFTEVRDGKMPRKASKLSADEIELVRNYVLNAAPPAPTAPNPGASPAPVPSPAPAAAILSREPFAAFFRPAAFATVSYDQLRAAVLETKCFRCHDEEFKSDADLQKATTDDGKPMVVPGNADQSPLFTSVRDGKMPKKGAKLTPAEVAMVRDYIQGLAP